MGEQPIQEPQIQLPPLHEIYSERNRDVPWMVERRDIIETILNRLNIENHYVDDDEYHLYNYILDYNNHEYSINFNPYMITSQFDDNHNFVEILTKNINIITFRTANDFHDRLIQVLQEDRDHVNPDDNN
jgi:hypothetical protein